MNISSSIQAAFHPHFLLHIVDRHTVTEPRSFFENNNKKKVRWLKPTSIFMWVPCEAYLDCFYIWSNVLPNIPRNEAWFKIYFVFPPRSLGRGSSRHPAVTPRWQGWTWRETSWWIFHQGLMEGLEKAWSWHSHRGTSAAERRETEVPTSPFN